MQLIAKKHYCTRSYDSFWIFAIYFPITIGHLALATGFTFVSISCFTVLPLFAVSSPVLSSALLCSGTAHMHPIVPQNGGCDDFLYNNDKFHPSWVTTAGVNLFCWNSAFCFFAFYLGERRGAPSVSPYMKYATYTWISYWMVYTLFLVISMLVLEPHTRRKVVSVQSTPPSSFPAQCSHLLLSSSFLSLAVCPRDFWKFVSHGDDLLDLRSMDRGFILRH